MKGGQWSLVLVLTLGLVLTLSCGSDAKAPPSKNVLSARKEDVKFIKCGVCEEIAKQLSRQVKKKQEKVPKKLTELEIIDITENICNLKKEEADWLMYLDIVEDGDKLELVEQQEEGECNAECKTIERACQEVIGDYDTDVAEFIFKGNAQRSAVSKFLCWDLSRACVSKAPSVPKDRKPGEPFTPKASKDAEMAKLMRTMSDMPGAPGMQMYSRDQLLKNGFGEDEDEDDDEDDDEQQRPEPTTGREPHKVGFLDQAQLALGRLKSGMQKTADMAAHGINALSLKARSWWYWNKGSSKRRKSSSSSKAKTQKTRKSEL